MASITKRVGTRKDGRQVTTREVQFVDKDDNRRTVRLGNLSQRQAEQFRDRLEELNSAQITGSTPSRAALQWAADLNDTLHARLANAGLIESRTPKQKGVQLGPFLADYVQQREVKPATKEQWNQAVQNLTTFYGPSRLLDTITEGDADRFKEYLIRTGLAPTTIHKRLQVVRQFFRSAVRHRHIPGNPFAEVSGKEVLWTNEKHFLTEVETDQLLEVCNPTWQLIVVLCRYGGLRCPSEVLSLKWEHVNWERDTITVPSPKTEHHPGKDQRVMPLFWQLRPHLEAAFERAAPGEVYVVGGPAGDAYRAAAYTGGVWRNCNLRTQFERLVKRARLKDSWKGLFKSMRSTRETELVQEGRPVHVVCAWLGNTPKVALKHYLAGDTGTLQGSNSVPTGPEKSAVQYSRRRTGRHQ